MEKQIISDIMRLNSHSKKHLLLNKTKICTFELPKELEDWRTYYYFSEFVEDQNCPRMTSSANVDILDKATFEKSYGKVFVFIDKDLDGINNCSMSLAFYDDEKSENPISMVTIQDCKIENDQLS